MAEDTNTNGAPMGAESTGTFTPPTYDIPPEHQALADEITNFDVVNDTAGPTTIKGAKPKLGAVKITALPPAMRQPIEAQVRAAAPHRREALEAELISKAVYDARLDLRIRSGPGANANTYEREVFELANERSELQRELNRIDQELTAVSYWDAVTDPETGKVEPKAIDKLQGQQRAVAEARAKELQHRLSLLDGPEADRRLAKARYDATMQEAARRDQLAIDSEARAMADQQLRDEKVKARADLYAKHKRTVV